MEAPYIEKTQAKRSRNVKFGIADREDQEDGKLEFDQPRSGFGGLASTVGARNLLIVIVTMPFVFLVVVMTIIGVFGDPNKDRQADAGSVKSKPVATLEEPALSGQRVVLPLAASAEDLSSAISLPEGADVGAISLDGDRLAVRIDTQDGAMIVIYDLAEKTVVDTVPLVEAGGSAMSIQPVDEEANLMPLAEERYASADVPTPSLAERKGE